MAGLMQLVANRDIENPLGRDIMDIAGNRVQTWGSFCPYALPRNGDYVNKLQVKISVGAAPPGFRWKRLWPLFFTKEITFEIGNQVIWKFGTEALRMKYLIDGFFTRPDWVGALGGLPNHNIPDLLRAGQEKLFDYENADERTRKSAVPQTCEFEPFNLDELTSHAQYPLPLICLQFHEVRVNIASGSLMDCLERIDANAAEPAPQAVALDCGLVGDYMFVDMNERRQLAVTNFNHATKHHTYQCQIIERPGPEVQVRLNENLLCSAAYVWITDENGNEIPQTVLDSLDVYFNGREYVRMPIQTTRFDTRNTLPHPTIPNTVSQNFYYISFFPGRREADGTEQGINLSRVDNYALHMRTNAACPQRILIHTLHRVQNHLQIRHGMGALRMMGPFGAAAAAPPRAEAAEPRMILPRPPAAVPFQNTDQPIPIPADEPFCMISYVDHKDGDVVQQCLGCHKVFSSENLDTWFADRYRARNCIHCRQPYNTTTFRKGKAQLAEGMAAAAALRPAEDVPLIAAAAPPAQQGGVLLNLLQHVFGGGGAAQIHAE